MTKNYKTGLKKKYKSYLMEQGIYHPVLDELIVELVDCLEISETLKMVLMDDPTNYNLQNNLTSAIKHVTTLSTLLKLTPQASTKKDVKKQENQPSLIEKINKITSSKD